MKERYRTFAGYNAWANRRLYEAAAQLSDADYRADRGVFFKSMHGTLNHLLATDYIWMQRFTGEGTAPTRLDVLLHDRFDALQAAIDADDLDAAFEAAYALKGVLANLSITPLYELALPLFA